jgi:TonB family protein
MAMALTAGPAAWGQDQEAVSPLETVRAQYDAFNTAYQAGDLVAAEAAARAALEAHTAAELGDDSRAVLLINLTIALIESGQGVAAQGALSQLLGLESSSFATYAPLITILEARADFLADPLTAAAAVPVLEATSPGSITMSRHAEALAINVAQASFAQRDFPLAARAWAAAAKFSEASTPEGEMLRGRAFTGQGVALLYADQDRESLAALTQAMDILAPFAAEGQTGQATQGEHAYAEAMAWRGAARAKLISDGGDLAGIPEPQVEPAQLADAPAQCPLRVTADPPPDTPELRGGRISIGAVVIAVSLNASGRLVASEVVASAPDPTLGEAVARVVDRWQFERAPSAPAGCRMERLRELRVVVMRGQGTGRRN